MTIEELKAELTNEQQELADIQRALADWKARHEDALDALHDAFDTEDEKTHAQSIVVMEAREAVLHFHRRVNELEKQVKGTHRRLTEAQYTKRRQEVQESQANARAALAAYEDELIEACRDLYEQSWVAQNGHNQLVDPFNQLADQVDGRHAMRISRMDGLDLFNYVVGVLQYAIHEGRLGS
jgi:chromosome segregation ATPase